MSEVEHDPGTDDGLPPTTPVSARPPGPGRGTSGPKVGLAISGGGFRATSFGLGALRALHDRGVLDRVVVVSGISDGSLLSAMWAYGPSQFEDFDESVVGLLRTRLQAAGGAHSEPAGLGTRRRGVHRSRRQGRSTTANADRGPWCRASLRATSAAI